MDLAFESTLPSIPNNTPPDKLKSELSVATVTNQQMQLVSKVNIPKPRRVREHIE